MTANETSSAALLACEATAESSSVARSVEYGGGRWHWFCLRDGCHWSGVGLFSDGGAKREADRHDAEFHPERPTQGASDV